MIEAYRLDYMVDKAKKYEDFKNFVLLSLKNTAGLLGDIFLVKKTSSINKFINNGKLGYEKYDMEISELDINTIKPIVKLRVSSALFTVIFSPEIVYLVIGSKSMVNSILE